MTAQPLDVAEPDWIDLNDWVLLNHPEVHRATRYISGMTIQMSAWLELWSKVH
ncbi:hypothetical protein [Paraburkholderia sp. UCT31]|uniref:hypothetical protein n=1 Tax=Paraburkholderia sp. UCT31 TaxID=2615209 RepID=UPI001655DA9A|nr:hypothetical protein [Paraburkholderia sp. UCT31]